MDFQVTKLIPLPQQLTIAGRKHGGVDGAAAADGGVRGAEGAGRAVLVLPAPGGKGEEDRAERAQTGGGEAGREKEALR